MDSSRTSATDGTSPLTRGKRSEVQMDALLAGNIPAHAGKTVGSHAAERDIREHPRSRGENFLIASKKKRDWGTSPLTRGKLSSAWSWLWNGRNIPAHAGKTQPVLFVFKTSQEHPRSRGENGIWLMDEHVGLGTSPLTRGKLFLRRLLAA